MISSKFNRLQVHESYWEIAFAREIKPRIKRFSFSLNIGCVFYESWKDRTTFDMAERCLVFVQAGLKILRTFFRVIAPEPKKNLSVYINMNYELSHWGLRKTAFDAFSLLENKQLISKSSDLYDFAKLFLVKYNLYKRLRMSRFVGRHYIFLCEFLCTHCALHNPQAPMQDNAACAQDIMKSRHGARWPLTALRLSE